MIEEFAKLRKERHAQLRAASKGADVSLLSTEGGFTAYYACAEKIHKHLGHPISDLGDGLFTSIPTVSIPLPLMCRALDTLHPICSVALLDVGSRIDGHGALYVCFCVIRRKQVSPVETFDDLLG